jgi:parallel beta-helix repeat protein
VVLSRLSFGRVDRKAVAVDAYECHLVVQGCVFTRIDTAIRAAGGADARVTGCVLTNVEMGLSGTKAKVTFEKNQITGSKKSVQLDWASGTVSQNRIMNAIADGVALNQSSDVRISDNYIEKSAQCGISLRASSPLVTGNELVANKYGIWCTDRSAPEIKRNIVRRSLAYDVGCERGASPLVGGSLAEANYFYGDGTYLLHNLTDYPVDARYNYWGSDCPESGRFSGQVRFTPWTDRTRQQEVSSCN